MDTYKALLLKSIINKYKYKLQYSSVTLSDLYSCISSYTTVTITFKFCLHMTLNVPMSSERRHFQLSYFNLRFFYFWNFTELFSDMFNIEVFLRKSCVLLVNNKSTSYLSEHSVIQRHLTSPDSPPDSPLPPTSIRRWRRWWHKWVQAYAIYSPQS